MPQNVNAPQSDAIPLEDIITPIDVNLWPPAIGWWLLCLALLGLLFYGTLHYRRHQKKWGYRNEALKLLDSTIQEWRQEKKLSDEAATQQLMAILKRTALTAYPNNNIEVLYGQEWLDVLKSNAANIENKIEVDAFIRASQYQKKSDISPLDLHYFCKEWVRKHSYEWQGDVI